MTNLFDDTQLQPAPKQTPASPLLGLRVRLDRPIDRDRPCCRNICVIGAARGPRAGELICTDCGQHRGWLSKSTAQWIEHVVTRFGAPTTPIVVREATRFEEKEEAPCPCAAPVRPAHERDIREHDIDVVKQLIAALGLTPEDIFLCRRRDWRHRRVAQLLYHCGLTVHDLFDPELPAVDGADGEGNESAPRKEDTHG